MVDKYCHVLTSRSRGAIVVGFPGYRTAKGAGQSNDGVTARPQHRGAMKGSDST
jgi:hypothetical protein